MLRGQSTFSGQSFLNPVITGGTINGTVIGGTTAAAGTFTTVTAGAIAGSDTSLDITGLAGTVGTGTTAGTVGGAIPLTAGNGGAKTGTGAAGGGAGGALPLTSGTGGATASTGSDDGGAGGAMTFTTGNGGAATGVGSTGNGGAAKSFIFVPGTGGATVGGLAGKDGQHIIRAVALTKAAVTAMTTSATISVAALKGGIITANQGAAGAATYTMPTGTVLEAAMPTDIATGDSFYFSVTNISTVDAEDVTLAGDTDMTAVGNMVVEANSAATKISWATFRIIRTGAHAYSFYRVG